MSLIVKICGLNRPEPLEAALTGGADMVGFVFFEKSPRHIDSDQARLLSRQVQGKAEKVALVVDADDSRVAAIIEALAPDWLQLHGAESPERVAALRKTFGLPILKALGVAEKGDFSRAAAYEAVADRLLFDAKPPKDAVLPGGNGLSFDWTLLRDASHDLAGKDWMLSGGLDPQNVAEAIRLTGAPGVDVSSGVETAPGGKSVDKILAFIAAARSAA
ncbi:phosphoribosylanthranilate isomerase [Rhodoblastus acidophilus]|uniref:N-(5'-phosphoribosyl)anthranilate isomerase n=1 Tax=Candidatus Rhodoblastus alkanivorans TaxID=2954117 RepID=A0ABS9Z1U8_9HYPH|nr:phosphoribosylanthranilate isomerase [Candidatus Rhodoblastus alkanivorans]MCI4678061.1 phosphoribosylanthranilate isomerase [Candidatus Rhodoblastus alkanivorans]MCI4681598.1 phosphoribosylanthranilate isomerase [Candidatus Rhodoblastus alkanivorans]MDI4642646.1 phosphoribosylanthranilate isomerase [Rhodoblastus acidophilus]